jgi:hypothetical protein
MRGQRVSYLLKRRYTKHFLPFLEYDCATWDRCTCRSLNDIRNKFQAARQITELLKRYIWSQDWRVYRRDENKDFFFFFFTKLYDSQTLSRTVPTIFIGYKVLYSSKLSLLNELHPTIQNHNSYKSFKSSLQKRSPKYFSHGKRKVRTILFRLWHECSQLMLIYLESAILTPLHV